MDRLFLIQVLLSFFIAGAWIAFSSLVAEKLGSKLGGLIANLPANLLISLLFVTFVRDVNYVTEAVLAVPAGLINTTIFLLVFVTCLRWGLLAASLVSLVTWFANALLLNHIGQINLVMGILCYVVFVILAVIALERFMTGTDVTALKKQYSKWQITGRAVFSGSVVAAVVVTSKFSPPYFTGIFATFPAMLFTTMFILARSQGPGFARSVGKVLVLTTSNLLIYALAVYFTYPQFGVAIGTLVSYLASVAWVFSLFPLVKRLA
jgi:hypothetical protein